MLPGRCEREKLFDNWADSYDEAVQSDRGFPFAGYEATLDRVAALACAKPSLRALKLGIGTGNLARRFLDLGSEVWGLDISARMLDGARAKVPMVRLVRANIAAAWPPELPDRFDRIISAYVFHHFALGEKVRLLTRFLRDPCALSGRIVVGDICFAAAKELLAARREWNRLVDPEEHYWIADEAIAACELAGLRVWHEQTSPFSEVFAFEAGLLG